MQLKDRQEGRRVRHSSMDGAIGCREQGQQIRESNGTELSLQRSAQGNEGQHIEGDVDESAMEDDGCERPVH